MQSILEWLRLSGLDQYAQVFNDNDLDLEIVRSLSEQDLEKLGVSSMGHRKKLLKAIAALTNAGASQDASSEVLAPGAPTAAGAGPTRNADGERRQLTVLFCDMVGFTELANRVDPEVLQEIIRSYEDACAVCISRYDGYVFQRLGDGIVAFFGYPLAHESEAERAIRAALQILESMSTLRVPELERLQVRVGIATGLVVVSSVEKGAVGETMNLASRLQGIAAVNTIVVSERVRRLAGGGFEYHELGSQSLKGITQPVRAYRVVGLSKAASRFEAATEDGLTPLVGRKQELGLLLERWTQARGGNGQVVLLSGEPGIGKSRIVATLRERLEADGAQAMRFQCSPYYVNSAFWPTVDNFERTLKFDRDEGPSSKLDKLEALVIGRYGMPRSDVRFIASMLSIACDERYGALNITPQRHKEETLRALVDLSEAAARKQSSVMLYEDVHWADPTTLEMLDQLVDRVKSMQLLIVLTHRPEFQSRWQQHGHVVELNLSRLTRAQSGAIVTRVAGGKALPVDLVDKIVAKTDGVPLFVEELTKSILESGELKETGEGYEYAGASHNIIIPATLRDSLTARLDRDHVVKEIAQIGAAIGRDFSYELLSAVAPTRQAHLDDALARLRASGLASRRGTGTEAVYSFKHALVQDAAYDSLLKSRRKELHTRIARAIQERFPTVARNEPEVLAHHLTAADRAEEAIPLWRTAGDLALKRMALVESIAHLDTGLNLVATLPTSAERDASELSLRILLGTACFALKGWPAPEVWNSLHPALTLAKSHDRNDALLPILWCLALNVMVQGRVAESLRWVNEMLDTGTTTSDSEILIAGHAAANAYHFFMGTPSKALEHLEEMRALYDDQKHRHMVRLLNHDPKTLAGCFSSMCTWMLGYPDRAVRLSDECVAHARRLAHPFDLGFIQYFGADLFDFRCEPEKVLQRAEECDRIGRDSSLPVLSFAMALPLRGVALIQDGKAAKGVEMLRTGLAIWTTSGGGVHSPYHNAVLAKGMAHLGDLDGALELINAQIARIEQPDRGERAYHAEVLRLKGWMLAQKGDVEGAERSYLASLDWACEQQAKSWELRTCTSLARLWQSQGRHKEALDLLSPVYDWFTEGFETRDLKDAKAMLGKLNA